MQKRALALFDFDGTLIKGDSIVQYVRFARKMKRMSIFELVHTLVCAVLGLCHIISDEKAKTVALHFMRRMTQVDRDIFDMAFAQAILPEMYKEGLDALNNATKDGKVVLLVSASTENYMRFVAAKLPVDALLCTLVDQNMVASHNCKGEEKLRRIDAWLRENDMTCDAENTVAYGDTLSDYPMLTTYGAGVCVNPKKALQKKAAGKLPTVSWGASPTN